jgi:hypothetical protein
MNSDEIVITVINESRPPKAFLDTNVLAQVVGGTKHGQEVLKVLRAAKFEIVTFRKCVYELYSILKGTTKDNNPQKNHPLKKFIASEVNDIAQKLFKKSPDIDGLGNTYFWYNLCEEWQGWEFSKEMEQNIESGLVADQEKAKEFLNSQKDFVRWKRGMRESFYQVDVQIKRENIHVCEFFQIFSSEWYKKEGYSYEQDFAQDSLIPNEDFEILMAAFFLNAKVFVTEDDKDLIWRGGLSIGLNLPRIAFCCPQRLSEAIGDEFNQRYYRRKNQ